MDCQKHLFALDSKVTYLNNAYRGPILTKAASSIQEDLERMKNPFQMSPVDFFTRVDRVKNLFANLIHATSEDIAIIPSTSYGFAVALSNWTENQGKKAVTVSDEFPSGYFSAKRWSEENHGQLIVVSPEEGETSLGPVWNQRILDSIDQETGVVLLSSVHWMNGTKFDLKEIGKKCREVGALFIVDGTQSVGMMPMDVEEFQIDALICATYKWMLGPYSLALGYFGKRLQNGKPLEESWMNRTNSRNFSSLTDYQPEYISGAGRFDVGETSHFLTLPILEESLKQILSWQPENMQAYARTLKVSLLDFQQKWGLGLDLGGFSSDHLFALPLPKGIVVDQVKSALEKEQIYVSVRGTALRVSINVFNESKDIEKLTHVLGEVYASII